MARIALVRGLFALLLSAGSIAWAASAAPGNDPLAAIDLNRNAIIADIVQGFEGDRDALARRLAGLRADHLLSASLASTRASLEAIIGEAEKSRDATLSRAGAKVLGSANSDLVYTPIAPCRLIDTRGFGAPIQGGPFAPNERRAYVPNGLCGLPTSGVASMLIAFTTLNLTPNSGGYLAILGPAAPVTTTVDIFNIGTAWSASNTAVATGPAAQFDVFVSTANPQVVIDILGFFAPPTGGVVTSVTAGTGLTGGTITNTGTVAIAGAYQLPQACTNGQVPQSNGAGAWSCVTPTSSGGTITAVTATAPVASSGGTAPNISLTGGGAGQVLVGTAGAPAWTDSPSISGNLTLVASTAATGNILKGSDTFLHNVGDAQTFLGQGAGNISMTGNQNTAVGYFSMGSNTTGSYNTAVGTGALGSNTSGQVNTAVGMSALAQNSTGTDNTAVGAGALNFNSSGIGNTAVGSSALFINTTGNTNTAIGASALSRNTTGSRNTASGLGALYNNTSGSFNTASGANALFSNTTGTFNTAAGDGALNLNTTGSSNAAFGIQALTGNTTGSFNVASGSNALRSNTTGTGNTAAGASALFDNTTGNFNTAVGQGALLSNTAGTRNTAASVNTLANNTTGNDNTALGWQALFLNSTGSTNTALGAQALGNITTGDGNVAIGAGAGNALTTGGSNIMIANVGNPGEVATIRIGNIQSRAFVAGIRGVPTGSPDAIPVLIDSNGQLGTVSSSRRFKDDIADMDVASTALMKLRPVTFHYKSEQKAAARTLQYGLIAEEVAEVYPGLVAHSTDGQVETVMYQYLPTMLLNEHQKLARAVETQSKQVAQLEQALADVAELKRQMAQVVRLLEQQQRTDTVTAGLGLK